jgi:hypothetical protein
MAKHAPAPTLEDQIKQAADDCGLTQHVTKAAGPHAPVGALGDGEFLKKFLSFLSTILPFILPLFAQPAPSGSAPPTP